MIIGLLLLLIGLKGKESTGFSVDQCNRIRGCATIYIILVHLQQRIGIQSGVLALLWAPEEAMILSNGLFFFISGYGLWKRRARDVESYMTLGSLIKRLCHIVIPAYLVYLITYPFFRIAADTKIEWYRYILGFGAIEWIRCNDVCWFLIELVIMYVLFWILFQKQNNEKIGICVIGIIILIWTIFAYLWGRGLVWYASTSCFLLGILIARNDRIVFNVTVVISMIVFLCSILTFIFLPERSILGWLISSNVSCITFCILVYWICNKYIQFNNIINKVLGYVFYELFLCHMVFVKYSIKTNMRDVEKICFAFAASFAVVVVLKTIEWLYNRLKSCQSYKK